MSAVAIDMAERSGGGATPRYTPKAARIEEGRALIAAGEVIDQPTAPVPEGFNLTQVVRLPSRTPEEVDEMRRKVDDPEHYTGEGHSRRDLDDENYQR